MVSNTGPSDAANLSVADTLPTQGLTNISSPSLPAGVDLHLGHRHLDPGHPGLGPVGHPPAGRHRPLGGHRLDLRRTRPPPRPPTPPRVSATDTDSLSAQATLAITKTDDGGPTIGRPGTSDTYTIVVSNSGPSDATNLSVVDTLPTQGLTNISSPNLPGRGHLHLGHRHLDPGLPGLGAVGHPHSWPAPSPSGATGSTYVNTATAAASDATTRHGHRHRHPDAQATLTITKTDGVHLRRAPARTDTYTIVVSNTGPSDAANLSVVDTLPTQGLTNISSPSLPAGVTFTSATDTWTLATLASGQSVTLQLAGTVPSGATGSTYVNTATAIGLRRLHASGPPTPTA